MGFLKNLFGGNGNKVPEKQSAGLAEGDIFYCYAEQEYHIYKLLRIEDEGTTFHVMGYKALSQAPTIEQLAGLEVWIQHFPVDAKGFANPVVITNRPVTEEDLDGYNYYLEMMREENERMKQALSHYGKANELADKRKYVDAIEEYSKAIEFADHFFEAIDNRAFCYMDLGQWDRAIADFRLSLAVQPESILAEFSIGECYMRLGDFMSAKRQFEKAIVLDPQHQPSKDFLAEANKLLSTGA